MTEKCEHCKHIEEKVSDSLNEVEIIYQQQDPSTMMALQHFSVKMKDKKRTAKNLLEDARKQLDNMLEESKNNVLSKSSDVNIK